MATVITSECINCGACEAECPNTAIYQGGAEWEMNGVKHAPLADDIFYIVPDKCTECVGFFDREACAAVCPVDCCVPDPNIPETEDVLIARSRKLHPDKTFADDFPSRFRKGGSAPTPAPAAVEAPKVAAPAAPAPESSAPEPTPVPLKPPAAPAPTPPAEPAAPTAPPPPTAPTSEAVEAIAPSPAKPIAPAPVAPAPVAPAPVAPAPPAKAAAPAPPSAEPAPVPATSPGVERVPAAAAQAQARDGARPASTLSIPDIDSWEVPIECFRCHATYAVAFKHYRSGVVFYCPYCQTSYVVTTTMHGNLSRALRQFHAEWTSDFDRFQQKRQRELREFEERQRARLEAFSELLKNMSRDLKPPGAPRKRAWIFG